MNKNNLITLSLLLSFSFGFSQTQEQKKAIIKDYNKKNIEALITEITAFNDQNKKDIEAYLISNPNTELIIKGENGELKKLKYIINNTPIYIVTDNINSAKATRTDFLHNGGGLGLNLEGQNMHVATWDGGPTLATHQEFLDDSPAPVTRVSTPDQSASNDQSNHSTHVSGTIIAKGVSPTAKGMAPKAILTSYDWDNDDIEALNEATTNALLLSNHSYGVPTQTAASLNWLMGCYNTEARIWDNVAYNSPYYLQVVSAGNDGQTTYNGGLLNNYDKLVGNKNSKNNLVVANANNPLVHPNGSGDLLSLSINVGSSQGPSDDGRIKPDISADGTAVFSPISTSNTSYASYNGTSMSAPNVTGSLLLLQQYYNDLNSQYMKASTLKGLACHTADDDFTVVGPDPIFGWGLLNAKRAAETILKDQTNDALILEQTLSQGETYTFDFTVTSAEQLSATICWTDPAGNDMSNQLNSPTAALVNDLDLRITQNSTTYFPWKLNLSNVAGFATTGDNLVDTVENIDINNPSAGSYTLTVTHKGTLTNSTQDFSLILTGSDLTLSTNENQFNTFNIWPNPASSELNYSFNSLNNSDASIILVDIQGRIIFKHTIAPQGQFISGKIDTQRFAKGSYVLIIKQGDSKINKKVILK